MSNGLDTDPSVATPRIDRPRLRRVAATGFVVGGLSLLGWGGLGIASASADGPIAVALLLGSYLPTLLGVGSLALLARRTEGPIGPGVTSLTIGLALLVPLPVGSVLELDPVPFTEEFLVITAAGTIAFVFGFAVFVSTLGFRARATFVRKPWGRIAGLLAVSGFLGLVVSFAFGQPDPPQAFRVVSPYTTPLEPVTLIVVTVGFGAIGASLCLLGVAVGWG